MVDCVPIIDNNNVGCNGGDPSEVNYYAILYAITTEKLYPYNQNDNPCSAMNATGVYKINSYSEVFNCNDVANALLVRPVWVTGVIDQQWQVYTGGVLPSCSEAALGGHCVQFIGVVSDGTENNATNYWIGKNSWGTGWGSYGFFMLFRDYTNSTGLCGFCQYAGFSN